MMQTEVQASNQSQSTSVILCEMKCAGYAQICLPLLPYPRILTAIEGTGKLETSGVTQAICARRIHMMDPDMAVRINNTGSAILRIHALVIVDPSLRASFAGMRTFHEDVEDASEALAVTIKSILKRIQYEQRVGLPGSNLFLKSLAAQAIAEIMRSRISRTRRSGADACPARERVRQYIFQLNQNFAYPQTIDDTARELNMSRRRFTGIFRDLTGSSWLDYLNDLRVQHAGKLLQSTAKDILSIAFECGYEDISTFYRNFRRIFGHAPSQHRKGRHIAA